MSRHAMMAGALVAALSMAGAHAAVGDQPRQEPRRRKPKVMPGPAVVVLGVNRPGETNRQLAARLKAEAAGAPS